MKITNLLIPIAAIIMLLYDIAYIVHSIKFKRYSAVIGMAILIILVCIGAVMVELQYLN